MSEFKFNCPGCGQHILANEKWVGRKINCPSCNTRITVPPPAKEAKDAKPVVPPDAPGQRGRPKLPGGPMKTEGVSKEAGAASAPAPASSGPEKAGVAGKAPKIKGERADKPVMPPGPLVQGACLKLPSDLPPAGIAATKEGRAVTGQTSGSELPRKQGKAAKQALSREAGNNGPVMPPGQGTQAKLPAGQMTEDAGAKDGVTINIPGPALAANGRKEEGAKVSAAKELKEKAPPAALARSGAPKEPGGRIRVELPVTVPEGGSTPVVPVDSVREEAEGGGDAEGVSGAKAEGTETAGEHLRVAVLSPKVKLEMVRAVRRRIADESAWLPGKVKGASAYAAKAEEGELVLLDATDPEATRFSLIGAFLREMHERQVVQTAVGRRRLLDEEIPDTIREVLLEGMSEEEREGAEDRLVAEDLLAISHAQCLAALDVLEARFLQRAEELQIEKAKRRLGRVRLAELVKKLEKKVRISPEEVATALYHELMEVRRRLERMEARLMREKAVGTDETG